MDGDTGIAKIGCGRPGRLPMMSHGLAADRGPGDLPRRRGQLPARPRRSEHDHARGHGDAAGQGKAAFGDELPLFGWLAEPGGTAGAAFMHTPPYPVVLTEMTGAAAAGLAAELAGRARRIPGVNAPAGAGSAFAAAWQEYTGQAARTGMRTRLYALDTLVPPDPPPPGAPRIASAADRDLLLAWFDAFHDEAGPVGPRQSERVVDDQLSHSGLILWEHEGRPVSLAGCTRAAAGQARIGPVYTPPGLRGRGFGGAATAAVTQAALDDGAEGVVLFTDLANPTSNTLYQRLGYRPIGDRAVLSFGVPGSDDHGDLVPRRVARQIRRPSPPGGRADSPHFMIADDPLRFARGDRP